MLKKAGLDIQNYSKKVDHHVDGKGTVQRTKSMKHYDNPLVNIDAKLTDITFNDDDDPDKREVVETYEVTITSKVAVESLHKNWSHAKYHTKTITIENVITAATPEKEKSRYFYYIQQYDRWLKTKNEIKAMAEEVEQHLLSTIDNGDGDAPGYLTNSNGEYATGYLYDDEGNIIGLEDDPYLMTEAERQVEVTRRDVEYLKKRFEIAEAVLLYATVEDNPENNPYAPMGIRESADVTKERLDEAKELMEIAKAWYDENMEKIGTVQSDLANLRVQIENLVVELTKLYEPLQKAEVEMMKARNDAIFAENHFFENLDIEVIKQIDGIDIESIEDLKQNKDNMDIAAKYFLEIAREKTDTHRNLQIEFDEIKANLENAKDEFDGLSNEHVVIMDNITTSYSEYLGYRV